MILRYVNSGSRSFGENPYLPFARLSWELYVVLDGFCGLILENDVRLPLKKSHFWMLPPNFVHGWYGKVGQPCKILVFHFASIPRQLEDIVPRDGFFERSLSRKECNFLQALEAQIEGESLNPTPLSDLRFYKALLEISLFLLEGKYEQEIDGHQRKSMEKVESALAWFRQHLRDHPTLEDVAAAVHLSPSHLRRLFVEVLKKSPSEAMNEIKIQAAITSLSHSDEKIESVALESGFSSASVFCRSFKMHKHCTPAEWRKRMPI